MLSTPKVGERVLLCGSILGSQRLLSLLWSSNNAVVNLCLSIPWHWYFLVRHLREELQLLQEPGSYVAEVVKLMGKTKVLVKVRFPFCLVVSVDQARMTPLAPHGS